MFEDSTAWFSFSVNDYAKKIWRMHGGREADFDKADFLFTDDSTSPDTQSVYNSDAYVNQHLAVFHSQYIFDCALHQGRANVSLGRYLLPPKNIVQLVGDVGYNWSNASANHQRRNIVIRHQGATMLPSEWKSHDDTGQAANGTTRAQDQEMDKSSPGHSPSKRRKEASRIPSEKKTTEAVHFEKRRISHANLAEHTRNFGGIESNLTNDRVTAQQKNSSNNSIQGQERSRTRASPSAATIPVTETLQPQTRQQRHFPHSRPLPLTENTSASAEWSVLHISQLRKVLKTHVSDFVPRKGGTGCSSVKRMFPH